MTQHVSIDNARHHSSVKGTLATYPALNTPGPSVKVCAALSPTLGLVMYETQLTAHNGQSFAHFMTSLCATDPVKGRSMHFVMDNLAVHGTEWVKDAMRGQSTHHEIKFLPKYSPHLNPIEYCFHNWKTEIKHIDQLKDGRTLLQQIDDTRIVITSELVGRIMDHVYQYYALCSQCKPLEEFVPLPNKVKRKRQHDELVRQEREEDEEKE